MSTERRPSSSLAISAAGRGPGAAPSKQWLEQEERGSELGMRALLTLAKTAGRPPTRALLRLIAGYYTMHEAAFDRMPYRASRAYLRRIFPHVTLGMVHRHILTFAECALDRLYFAVGHDAGFEITLNGNHHLETLARERRGALLLGAHLGSFEAMRFVSRDTALPLHILAHFDNARKITRFLQTAAPDFQGSVIAIDPASPHFVLTVRERIEAGELVAVLGDRTGLGEDSEQVPFMGDLARFPTGPYMLAAVLRCPIYLTFGLYHRPNRYSLYCEPFAGDLNLPRRQRKAALAPLVARFARRLEYYCRLAPYNWFNFFDFWEEMKTEPRSAS